jgi:hypothetical protein
MTRYYSIEVKFGNTWRSIKIEKTQSDAMYYVSKGEQTKYPYRIVKVIRTIVFNGER